MAERISRKPDELAQQCKRASNAIGGEPAWPAPPAAPIAMTLLTRSQNINTQVISGKSPATQLSVINSLESQLRTARQVIKPFIEDARADLAKVDQATEHSGGEYAAGVLYDAVYEIQWFTDAALTQMIGSATVTATPATSKVA